MPFRRRAALVFATASLVLAAGCQPGGGAPATSGPGQAPAATADAGQQVPVGAGTGVCLRLRAGEELTGVRVDGEATTAALRHSGGTVDVYVGPLPDFPGFRRVTRGLPDTPTPGFVAIAEAHEHGRRFLLAGHKRDAAGPRLYAMFSGAEAMFAPGLDTSRILAC